MLSWKGSVLLRQQHSGLVRSQPELSPLLTELQSISAKLGRLVFSPPDAAALASWQQEIDALTEDRERLESELAERSTAFRQHRSQQARTPADLQASLPESVALVDFLDYNHLTPHPAGKAHWAVEHRLIAFVVRKNSIVRIDLGPQQAALEAVNAWRESYGGGNAGKTAGLELRRQVWEPLLEHLADVEVVLVSPDHTLSRVPLPALPGKAAGKYLIEEQSVVIVPVPQMIPELLSDISAQRGAKSLLAVGGIDFDAEAGRATDESLKAVSRGSDQERRFSPLPGTAKEVNALMKLFSASQGNGEAKLLTDEQATEGAFRSAAGGKTFIHLATHGFFAAEGLQSLVHVASEATDHIRPVSDFTTNVASQHPGLLSGVVFAGANRSIDQNDDDGIFTALELSSLDLTSAELMVLSACETGLGEADGSEGVLGLQRAAQAAGTQTVISSLWKVPDEPTRILMERFYSNLWSKNMGKLAALREAQIWMLRKGATDISVRRDAVARGIVSAEEPATVSTQLPPYYWAAFVLSGDWR